MSSTYATDEINNNYNNQNDMFKDNLTYEDDNELNQVEYISSFNETPKQINTTGIIMSDDSYSCGAASFATVLNNFGKNISLTESKIATKTSENGTTMSSIMDACKLYNLTSVGLNVEAKYLKENYIIHMNINGINHWSVFKNITENYVYLADPNLGNYKYDIDEFIEYYTNISIAIFDNLNMNPLNSTIKVYSNENLTKNKQIYGFGYADYKTVKISKNK